MKKYSVKRSYKKTGRIMAIFLACMIFLNNESIYSVLAAENSAKAAADGGESQDTTSAPEQGGDDSGAVPGGGEGGGTESGPSEGGEGGGTESGPSEGGEGTVPGDGTENKPSEGGEGTVPGDGTENKPSEGGEGTVPGDGTENKPSEGGEGTVPGDGTENKPSEGGEGTVPGDGTENKPSEGGEGIVPGDGTENKPSEGDGSGTGDKTEETEPPEGDDIPEDELPADGIIDEEVKENDGEGEGENSACLEDREHEYEEILAEDGTVECYRCVFCQREISEETLEMEGAVLHAHLWNRAEGEIIPVCEDCGLARLDCDGEEGYGIHIFELIQEEGQPDRYRCAVCGEEKEFLDEWDMTAELFFEIMGISVYVGVTYTYNGETSELPTNKQELTSHQGTNFDVQNLADLMALQLLSKDGFDFKGYTVQFLFRKNADGTDGPANGTQWDLRELKGDFSGLGSEDAPFRGTLTSVYDSQSFNFQTATPLLNYVATGAIISKFQINADIEGDGSSPLGGIAAHVVKSDGSDTVEISNISLSGRVANPGGTVGGLFGEVINTEGDSIKIRYEKSSGSELGISLSADVSGACAGGLVGKTEGAVEVYKTDVFPTGTVSGTEYAGMLAGSMEAGGTLFADETGEACEVKVEGSGTNGGLAGKIAGGTICRADQAGTQKLILTGSVTGGRNAGGLVGECADTKIKLNDVTVSAEVTASAGNAGGMVGSYAATGTGAGNADAPDEDWNLLHHIEIGGNVRGTGNIGGIIGDIKGNNFRIGLPGEADNFDCMRVTGSIFADHAGACVGGMIGAAEGEYIEVYHVTMSGGEISGADTIGGIIGRVGNGAVVKIKNATVSSRLIPSGTQKIQGGILGNVLAGSMAAMDGTINVEGLAIDDSSLLRGHIAGKQDEALVYFEENCKYQRPTGKAWVDDIGNYGGVYRNGTWGEDGNPPLISYKEKKVLGTVASSGSEWVLDSEADMIRLAIVLNTEGRFAGDCFGNTGKADLLKADYSLTKQEYVLKDSGIYAFNRNDRGNMAGERFTGKLTGTGKATIDLGECVTYQSYLSLFPCAGEGTEFRNLTVKRDIKYARDAAAGLAVYISDDVLVENVDMQVSLTGSSDHSAYLYGGMFAEYSTNEAATLDIENSRIGGELKIAQGLNDNGNSMKQCLGGLLAKYTANTGGTPVIKINTLELAVRIVSDSRLASGMITQINNENINVDSVRDRVTLDMQNISITKEAGIEISDGGETGGFLGWKWYGIAPCNGNYSIKNLVIGDGGTAADGPSYSTRGGYGGLVHTVTGRIQFRDLYIKNGSFYANPAGGSNHNGLLFHNGHNALIELENYQIAGQDVGENSINYAENKKKVSVTGVTANFGEVVGSNMGNDKDHRSYTNGGIVNIISPAFKNSFIVNRSHVLDVKTGSNNTRYYYNLFGTSLDGEASFMQSKQLNGSNIVITDADQLIIWHLSQYMNESLRRYLEPYFTGGTVPAKNGGVTISGTIDLNRKSYYPTPVQNCTVKAENSATIVFYGDQLDQENGGYTLAEKEVDGEGTRRENYMLQGGLLVSPEGEMTVQGDEDYLTLKGKVTRLHEDSGALFVMSIKGTNNIYRIRLEDLYLRGYGGAAHGYGLMIGAIEDGTNMNISWIETKGYNSSGRPDYAAAALIGRVGTAYAENLRLDFTNMKIGGLHPDKNPSDRSQAIFKYAIFIDFHHFTDNTQRNKGRVRYLFTEEAYKGKDMLETGNDSKEPFMGGICGDNNYGSVGKYVTLGNELQNGVEYWNTEGDADFLTDGSIADWNVYLPYVCTANNHGNKDIQVNPKNVSIQQGCGTYEDPYQIESAKQLLALSYYLINGDGQEYLKGWQIRTPGDKEVTDGNGICTKTHLAKTLKTYGNEDFPTREELRKAYYIITDDIDFSKLRSSGDAAVVQSFVGLGTTDYPFAGVIAGEKKVDGSVPTITLPHKRKENTSDYFGLIEYAKGAVVKDIKIVSPETPVNDNDLLTKVVRVRTGGSAVIGCVLGGDNIIDNVTVETLMAVNAGTEGFDAAVGGYAGIVEQGSLILRNLSADHLSGFRFGLLSGNGEELEEIIDLTNYPFASGAVGRVENGFVIYEGNVSGGAGILPHDAKNITGLYSHNVLPFSNTYDVITASGMENEKNKIQIIGTGVNYTCNIVNAAQLQLVSMAINSDSFSVYYDGGGYDKFAACRKAKYDEVGNVTGPTSEYTNATQKDDGVYWYPYIYQYFSFGGTSADDSNAVSGSGFYSTLARYGVGQNNVVQYRSELNAVTKDVSAFMTYKLTGGTTYDLSVYQRGFRGLGATYRVFDNDGDTANLKPRNAVYSDFRANFDGNGATVKAEMVNDYAKGIHTAALFNDLVNTDVVNDYSIKNLIVTGTFRSSNSMEGDHRTNFAADRAAAVVGMMRRPWEISNVTAKNVDVWSKGQAAGIVAWINLPDETRNKPKALNHSFTNCKVLSVKESGSDTGTVIHTLGGSCGGIVGSMATWHNNELDGYTLTLKNCKVLGENSGGTPFYVKIENDGDKRPDQKGDDQEAWGRGRSGAMAGFVGKHHLTNGNITRITVQVTDSSQTDADIQYVSINGGDSTGGVLGEYYGWRQNETAPSIKIENIQVSNSIIESKNRNETVYGSFGVGGIIGKLQREATCEITNTNVVDTDIRSTFGGTDNGVSVNTNAPQGDQHAGGIIGYCYYKSRITMENVQVTGALRDGEPQYEITSRLSNAGGMIGACWDGKAEAEVCKYITIKTCKVSGMNISSDSRSKADRNADKASGTSTGAAGGIIGRASAVESCTIQDITVENCAVRSGQGAAGGVIGNAVAQLDSLLENISVTSCKIGSNGNLSDINVSMGMGGIYGRVSVLDNRGSQKLKGTLKIEQCDIYGKNAGGIAGSVDHSQQIGNVWSYGNSGHSISIKRNSLLGYYAGGAFGTDNSRKNCFTNVQITGNTIAAIGNAAANAAAGGFSGRKDTSSNGENSHNINDITVENNKIFSSHMTDSKKQSAGGAFGSLNLVNDIYAYNTVVKNNEIGFCDIVNDPAVKQIFTAGIAGQMSAVDAAMTAIKGQTVKLWNGSGFVSLPANLTEADVSTYSGYYGNMAGTYEVDKKKGEGHAYFLKPTVAYAAGTGTRPTVDVGSMAPGTAAGNALLSDPYAYRRNIHVIYFEPDISAANTAAGLWAGASMNAEDLFSGVNADEKLEEYRNVMGSASIAASGRLNAYRLNIMNESGSTVSDIYKNVYKNDDGYLSNVAVKDKTGTEIMLPMIVLDTQYGTVDQLMGGVLAALTGAGGVQNSETFGKNADSVYDTGINEIMDISVTSMKVENGAVVADNSGRKQSIRYNGKGNGYDKAEILYNNYDEEDEDGKGLTFSMLTVSYRQKEYAANDGRNITGNVVELKIPVYVVERLTIDTYLKMVEGEVYNADKAKEEQTGNNPLLANDSTYTLYMEYIYGSARDKYSTDDHPISIDKTLGITYTDEKGNAVPTGLWPGTRLTLIDVCDSNKVYYYTVKEGDTVIRYEQFLSDPEDPNSAYKNKPIHGEKGMDIYKDGAEFPAEDREEAYTDVAVERFLIVVDTSLVDEDLKLTTRNVRDYHMTPVLSDDIKKRASLTEHTEPKVTMQPGLTIGFDGKGTEGITDIAGIIQDGAEVEVDATFRITGEKTYWLRALNSQTTTIDSANHNKYLEVGIYFTDMNGNRVRLPDNTNVTVKGDRIKPWEEEIKEEENIGAYVNRTEVYFYKDGKIFFPLDKLREIVQKDIAANGENNFSGVISEQLKVILNFANADLSAYTENRYVVNLELLRIEDADYPAGGEVMDIYSKDLIARRQTDLACALETKDLMELGINTYQNQTPMPHMINFGFKLDFNGILSDTNHTMNQQLAEKYYTVSYHILEKTNQNGTPEYKPYTGNQLSLALTAPPSSDMQKGLQKGGSSVGEFGNSVYVTYKYALREIENGTGDAGKGVITRDLTLTVRDAAKMDLSNYKIVASVMVSDQPPGNIETEVNPALSDFFVFTIAKLKTDLDY